MASIAALSSLVGLFPALTPTSHLDWLSKVAIPIAGGALVLLVFGAVGIVLRYGRIDRAFQLAAQSDEASELLTRVLNAGMNSTVLYGALRDLYLPEVNEANTLFSELGLGERFRFVDGGAVPEWSATPACSVALRARGANFLSTAISRVSTVPPRQYEDLRAFADERQQFMKRMRSGRGGEYREDERGDNFTLIDVTVQNLPSGPAPGLTLGVAEYGQIVRSCDSLLHEFALLSWLAETHSVRWRLGIFPAQVQVRLRKRRRPLKLRPDSMLKFLKWRRQIHRNSTGNLFLQPSSRAAGLGVAVVTLMPNHAGELCVWLGRRSDNVGTYPGADHVVPAGMCNTHGLEGVMADSTVRNSFLEATMKSEFLEEWLSISEYENSRRTEWMTHAITDFPTRVSSFAGWELSGTGISYDFLNLRPEICAILRIESTASQLNWEYASQRGLTPWTIQQCREAPVVGLVQSGAAALALAMEMLKERGL